MSNPTLNELITEHPGIDSPALRDSIRLAILEERSRILAIIEHGNATNDLRSALSLALTTELSAADAIEILDAKQTAGIIRAN